jgi:putative SOS response-associated peptidase YedK
MCNRYRVTPDQHAWAMAMGVKPLGEFENLPPPEIFPRRQGWTVRSDGAGRIAEPMTWGFPSPAAGRAPVTNVRNLASPFWRSALANPERRCLVPVNEFCEWEGEAGSKVARWFSVPSLPTFAFAGIWRPIDAGAVYAFLTCEPNALVAPVHPKAMPVMLQPEDHERWLSASIAEARQLASPFPSQLMAVA